MRSRTPSEDTSAVSRRRYLKYVAGGVGLTLAGCLAAAETPIDVPDRLALVPDPFTGTVHRELRDDGVDIELEFPNGECKDGVLITVARGVPSGDVRSIANVTPVSCVERPKMTGNRFEFDFASLSKTFRVRASITYPPVDGRGGEELTYMVYYAPVDGVSVDFESAQYVWETPTFVSGESPPHRKRRRLPSKSWYSDWGRFSLSERDGQYLAEYEWRRGVSEVHVSFAVSQTYHRIVTGQRRSYYLPGHYHAAQSDPFVQAVARAIGEQNGLLADERRLFLATVRFVQSLKYTRDGDAYQKIEYPKPAIETLVDGTGDCEDTSFLLAGLLASDPLGYHTALYFPPGHVAVGVDEADLPFPCTPNCVSTRVEGRKYVYVESTNVFPVGESAYGDPTDYVAVYDETGWHRLNPASFFEGIFRELSKIKG